MDGLLSLVIPVYNEAESLGPLVDEIDEGLAAHEGPYEIVFVDDGSGDRSFEVMQGLVEKRDDVRVVRLRRNFGKATALSHGFAAARGDIIVTMDGDRQDDPAEIPGLMAPLSRGYDLVSGWKQRRQDPLNKTLPSRFFNWTVRTASGIPLHDFNCGLKAYRRDVTETISVYGELHRYIPVVAAQAGFRVTEVKVNHRRRTAGRSKYGWRRYMRGYLDLLTVLFLGRYQHRPQHLFGGLGTLLAVIGVIIELYLTVEKLVFGEPIGQRPLLLLGALLIIVGIQLLSLGLVGELIANSRARRGPDPAQIRAVLEPAAVGRAPSPGRRRDGGRRRSRRVAVIRSIAYFGTADPDYPRNAVLLAGLREHGVEVHEFRAPLPALSAADMTGACGTARMAIGVAAAHARLVAQHRPGLRVDAVVVGYPGHFLVPAGRLVAAWRRARLVFDPLVSLFDTFADDRALVRRGGVKATAIRTVDEVAFGLPDLVLADTWSHGSYYQEEFGLARGRVAVVPVGAWPEPRARGSARRLAPDEPLTVLQYGKWSPLHGADVVLAAAERLRADPVRFVLVGEGQLSRPLRATLAARRLTNVRWLGRLPARELRAHTLAADVCLGVFGRSEKAARVIPNKVYDALACGRPVVTADSDGAREWLRDGESAVLTPAGDAAALADALRRLLDADVRARLGEAGLALYRRAFTPAAVAARLLAALEDS